MTARLQQPVWQTLCWPDPSGPRWFPREIKQREQMAPEGLLSQQVKLKDAAVSYQGSPPAPPRCLSPPSYLCLSSRELIWVPLAVECAATLEGRSH